MNIVSFPGLNLTFNISRIAFSIGNIDIYWYAICIVLGIAISLILCSKTKENFNISYDDFLEIVIVSLVFGFIGARFYYVIFNLGYYIQEPFKMFNVRDGGLAIYGGIIFGALVAYIVCKKKKISSLDFFDYICPYVAFSQAIGRIGNFFNVEAYGNETTHILRMGIFNETGYAEVHPCFLYECIGCLAIFIILRLLQKKRKFSGQIISLYLILYGVVRFLIEGIRSDSLMLSNFRISQIVSFICIVLGIYFLYRAKREKIKKDN